MSTITTTLTSQVIQHEPTRILRLHASTEDEINKILSQTTILDDQWKEKLQQARIDQNSESEYLDLICLLIADLIHPLIATSKDLDQQIELLELEDRIKEILQGVYPNEDLDARIKNIETYVAELEFLHKQADDSRIEKSLIESANSLNEELSMIYKQTLQKLLEMNNERKEIVRTLTDRVNSLDQSLIQQNEATLQLHSAVDELARKIVQEEKQSEEDYEELQNLLGSIKR